MDITTLPSVVEVTIKSPRQTLYLGGTDADICPVLALLPYPTIRGPGSP